MKKLVLGLAVLNVALAAAPLLVLLPFLAQTRALLAIAYAAKSVGPAVAAVSVVIAAASVLWRGRSWGALVSLALILACAALSRVNYVEWMFAPANEAETVEIRRFNDIRDDDMVIGVRIGGESRAYPVRYLAYHHMLNDRLGSTALLPTY